MIADSRMLAFFALKACPVPGCLTLGEHEAHLNNETGEVSHDHTGWSFYATKRTLRALPQLNGVLAEVRKERVRQHAKWGQQDLADGTGGTWEFCNGQHDGWAEDARENAIRQCQEAPHQPWGDTFALILNEEFAEAMAETDPERLRSELVQVAAGGRPVDRSHRQEGCVVTSLFRHPFRWLAHKLVAAAWRYLP